MAITNPLVSPGTLNRLVTSVTWPNFPQLNVTPPYLGKASVNLGFEGAATGFLQVLAGAVTSPEPYLFFNMTINLIRSQSLADSYKTQMEASTLMGDCTVRSDSYTLSVYQLSNCAIEGVNPQSFAGDDANYMVTVKGIYYINANLWNT